MDAGRARLGRGSGLAIFPTHRVFDGEALLSPNGSGGDPAAALELRATDPERAAVVQVTAGGASVVEGEPGRSTSSWSTGSGTRIAYTDWEEAVRRVRSGEAGVAYLLRPTRIGDVWAAARRGG